jgi:large conductance mechanosensitive channel
MSKQLSGFVDFIREQGVVGLAIGLAIGTQAGILVKDIVSSIIDPILGLIIGNSDGLSKASWTLYIGDRSAKFLFGQLVYSLIVFLSVCAVVYFVAMGLKLDKLDKKKS